MGYFGFIWVYMGLFTLRLHNIEELAHDMYGGLDVSFFSSENRVDFFTGRDTPGLDVPW